MIEQTASRFADSGNADLKFESMLVVGSKRHEALLDAILPNAKKILEPFGRNSASAVAAACLALEPDDLILILPADHDIRDVPAFHEAIAIAAKSAQNGAIVTFGIKPTHPATGYGYIKSSIGNKQDSALDVESFVEKPNLETAKSYLDAGVYYWNAGIFLFKASTMLEALSKFAGDVLEGTRTALPNATHLKTDLDPVAFANTPNISIDYAVMERATNVKTVPVSMGWSDVGGYRALHELLTHASDENYTHGPVSVQNSRGLFVRSEGPVIAINGVSDLIVVATEREVMITPMSDDGAAKVLGQTVQSNRYALGLSKELVEQARAWLWGTIDAWSKAAWDNERGGFVEQLLLDGGPDATQDRRVRVQARQVYTFSKAIAMGWTNVATAQAMVDRGIDYIDTRLRHPGGGFVHRIDAAGNVLDDRRDLYDHAFMILAGAAAYRLGGDERALQIAHDAMAYVDGTLINADHGGWDESCTRELPRRANPHMHLLEAMLELHGATGSETALRHAATIVDLFETRFFNPSTNTMAEYFQEDWSYTDGPNAVLFEPGHHYEWATLLFQYSTLTGHDTLSWRRRLIRKADQVGLNPETGFSINAVRCDGTIVNNKSRLWHQLERFRCYLLHPGMVPVHTSEGVLQKIMASYLVDSPEGVWVDQLDASGSAISESVPASMLYHLMTAFNPLIPA